MGGGPEIRTGKVEDSIQSDAAVAGEGLDSSDLLKAIEHLYRALGLLTECREILVSGTIAYDFPQKIEESWLEVNKCRLFTQDMIWIEEILQPVLGLINDAKCMFETLVARNLGMTRHGYLNIMQCMDEAAGGIRNVVEELEDWLKPR
jgi:hypothetical protein